MALYEFKATKDVLLGIWCKDISYEEKIKLAVEGISVSELKKNMTDTELKRWEKENKWAEEAKEDLIPRGHLFLDDEDYPESLINYMEEPPFCLAYIGAKPKGCKYSLKHSPSLCITGTREATDEGRRSAFLLGIENGANGNVLYTGYATGIDQAGMHGAVSVGSACFGILPCGLDFHYAKRNQLLRQEVFNNGGGFISPFYCDGEPLKENFKYRNKLLAYISPCIVMVEAPKEGSSMDIVRCGLECGKDVFVHRIGTKEGNETEGGRELVNDGAIVIENYNDLKVYTLNSYKGDKYVTRVEWSEIEKEIKEKPTSHRTFYRFRDNWYVVADKETK